MEQGNWNNEENKDWESPNPLGESPNNFGFYLFSNVPSPEEENQVGNKKEQSVSQLIVLR